MAQWTKRLTRNGQTQVRIREAQLSSTLQYNMKELKNYLIQPKFWCTKIARDSLNLMYTKSKYEKIFQFYVNYLFYAMI